MKKFLIFILSFLSTISFLLFSSSSSITRTEYVAKRLENYSQIKIDIIAHAGEGMMEAKDSVYNYSFNTTMFRNHKLLYESFASDSFCPIYCDGNPARVLINDVGNGADYLDIDILFGKDSEKDNEIICNEYTAGYYGITEAKLPFSVNLKGLSYGSEVSRDLTITGVFRENYYTSKRVGAFASNYCFLSHSTEFKNQTYGYYAYVIPVDANYFSNCSVISAILDNSWCSYTVYDSAESNVFNQDLTNVLNKKSQYKSFVLSVILLAITIILYYLLFRFLFKYQTCLKYNAYLSTLAAIVFMLCLDAITSFNISTYKTFLFFIIGIIYIVLSEKIVLGDNKSKTIL